MLAIGRVRDRRIHDLCDEYLRRIRRHLTAEIVEVSGRGDRVLLEKLGKAAGSSHVVALDAAGRQMASEPFARHLEDLLARCPSVSFLVGAAEGLPAGALEMAGERISLSPLTLPHRLARLVLLEQLYRATTIMRGEPYHK